MDRLTKLLEFLSQAPKDAFNLYAVANEYMQQGALEEAKKYFLQLKELHPDYVGLYYHLGKIYFLQENFEQAKLVYEEGITQAKQAKDLHAEGELQRALRQAMDELEEW
ncbi:MAG: tetratricopeptide repeat protein [Bacteroidota bacterium]